MRCRLFAMVLAAWTLPVCAQSLYKCPDPATGVVKYSQTPCTINGEGEVLNVKPIPPTGGSTPPVSLEETHRVQQLAREAGVGTAQIGNRP